MTSEGRVCSELADVKRYIEECESGPTESAGNRHPCHQWLCCNL